MCDQALELRAQEVVLGGVVSVKCGPPNPGFLDDLADADAAVAATMQQGNKRGVDSRSSSSNTLVFALASAALRDVCRFLFRN